MPRRDPVSSGETGYVLLAVLFFVALITLSLAVAAPVVARSIQRDREVEAVHRGEQYERAIKLYYQKFNAYPTSIDQLVKSNDIRFLRRKYLDPLTGKDDWKLIHMGEAHVKPLGFFGQPLAMAGATSSIAGATPVSAMSGAGIGSSSAGGFGSTSSSSFGSSLSAGSAASTGTGSTAGTSGLYASDDNSGTGAAGTGTASAASGGLTGSLMNSGSNASTAMAFNGGSGGPIVGVTLPSDKKSLLAYRLQDHYNRWEFVYDPIVDQMQGTPNLLGGGGSVTGTDATSSSLNGFGSTSGIGSGLGAGSTSGTASSFSGGFGSAGASNSSTGSSSSFDSSTSTSSTNSGGAFAGGFGTPQ